MAEVRLQVAGRSYRLLCRDGEENALRAAGAFLDERMAPLLEAHGAAPESRLLLMAALTLAGELLEKRPAEAPPAAGTMQLRQLLQRAEALAKRLEEAAATS